MLDIERSDLVTSASAKFEDVNVVLHGQLGNREERWSRFVGDDSVGRWVGRKEGKFGGDGRSHSPHVTIIVIQRET